MTLDLDRQLRDYVALLDETLPEITADLAMGEAAWGTPPVPTHRTPTLRWIAVAAVGVAALLLPLLFLRGTPSDVVTTLPDAVPSTVPEATGLAEVADLPSALDAGWEWVRIEKPEGYPVSPFEDGPMVQQLPDGSWVMWTNAGYCVLPDGTFAGPNDDGSGACSDGMIDVAGDYGGIAKASMWSPDLITWRPTDSIVVGGYFDHQLISTGIGRVLDASGLGGWVRLERGVWEPLTRVDDILADLDPSEFYGTLMSTYFFGGPNATVMITGGGDTSVEYWFTPDLSQLLAGPLEVQASSHLVEYAAIGDRWYRVADSAWSTTVEPGEWMDLGEPSGLAELPEDYTVWFHLGGMSDRLVLNLVMRDYTYTGSPGSHPPDPPELLFVSADGRTWQQVEPPTNDWMVAESGSVWFHLGGSDEWLTMSVQGAAAITRDFVTWYRLEAPEGDFGSSVFAIGWGEYAELRYSASGAVTFVRWAGNGRLEWPPVVWPIWVAVPTG